MHPTVWVFVWLRKGAFSKRVLSILSPIADNHSTQPIRRGPLNSLAPRSEFFAELSMPGQFHLPVRSDISSVKASQLEVNILRRQIEKLTAENVALLKKLAATRVASRN